MAVTVVSCRDLLKADFIGKNDPFVCVTVGGTTMRTSTLDDAGSDPVWGLERWDEEGSESFDALLDPKKKAALLEDADGETFGFIVAFPVPALCRVECFDEDYGPMNPDDLLGSADIRLGQRDNGGGNPDKWNTQTWLTCLDSEGNPSGEVYVRVAIHETTLEALADEPAEAVR